MVIGPRLRVVPLSLSPSCVTRKKTARKKWPHEIRALLAPRISRGHFFLVNFFRVTHDRLSERGTTHSLYRAKINGKTEKEQARSSSSDQFSLLGFLISTLPPPPPNPTHTPLRRLATVECPISDHPKCQA